MIGIANEITNHVMSPEKLIAGTEMKVMDENMVA